jgi:hypothetical protein
MVRQIELNDEQSGDDILLCTYESPMYSRAFPHFLREETSVRMVGNFNSRRKACIIWVPEK